MVILYVQPQFMIHVPLRKHHQHIPEWNLEKIATLQWQQGLSEEFIHLQLSLPCIGTELFSCRIVGVSLCRIWSGSNWGS